MIPKIYRFLMIFFSIFLLLIILLPLLLKNLKAQENHLLTSDILIDFSSFEQNIEAYAQDFAGSSPIKEPIENIEISNITEFGDPCRIEIVNNPEKLSKFYNGKFSPDDGIECYERIRDENKLPFTVLWRDMLYSKWQGLYYIPHTVKENMDTLNIADKPDIKSKIYNAGSKINLGNDNIVQIEEDTKYLSVHIHFPISNTPYYVIIKPKFPVYEYDSEGMPVNRAKKIERDGNITEGNNAGIIDNIKQIKDIELNIIGLNSSNKIYIVLSNEEGSLTKYFMGWIYPHLSKKPLKWSNSDYVTEPVNYLINPIPTSPDELKYVKFHSFMIESDPRNTGKDALFLIKDIKLYYDYQIEPDKLSFDIKFDEFWEKLTEIGRNKWKIYQKYAQSIILKDLKECYNSPNRIENCKYSK